MPTQDPNAPTTGRPPRSAPVGVYAVICSATGEAWVGCSANIDTQQTELWAALRQASGPSASLQEAWTSHDEADFRFEELDRLADDFPELGRTTELKKRQALWQARLGASAL